MKKILGGLSVILLIGITLRLLTGQQLKADDVLPQTTDSSVSSVESVTPSETPDLAPVEENLDEKPEEIPVIPEKTEDDPNEESVSEDSTALENSTDSSSEESVESSSSISSESSSTGTSTTTSGTGATTSSSTSSSSSSSKDSSTSGSSSTTPSGSSSSTSIVSSSSSTNNTSSVTSESSDDPQTTFVSSGFEYEITEPENETASVIVPNLNSSVYSPTNSNFSSTTGLDLDQSLKTSDVADSELKGFELPLLTSFEDKRQAAVIYEAIKQLGLEQNEELTTERFVSDIYQRVVNRDLSNLETKEVSEDQLIAGDILYTAKDDQQTCIGLYLGDGYLISVNDSYGKKSEDSEDKEDTEQTEKQTEESGKDHKKSQDSKEKNKNDKKKETTESSEKESKTKETAESDEEEPLEIKEKEDSPLIVQQTSDRENDKCKWLVYRENTNDLTTYGQELLKEYPASMDFSANQQTKKFVETIGEDAQRLGQEYDVFASVMIAQAILESGSGTSGLSVAPYYNLFGIKGSYKGNAVNMATQEDGGSGNMYTIQSAFRSYPNYAASLGDYVELIRGGISGSENYYKDVWRSEAKNYLRASEKLTGKYATDTSYHRKLTSLISVYHLTEYDRQQVQAETPLSGTGGEYGNGIFIKGKNEIPEEYAKLMKYEDYNGKNYNSSGSYPVGQCTWYAFNRVAQLGKSVDDFMGNGGEWGTKGRALGYEVSSKPKAGKLISFTPGVAGSDPRYGHVAFVEAVGPNGILISEGNVYGGTVISYRVISNDLALSNLVSYVTPK